MGSNPTPATSLRCRGQLRLVSQPAFPRIALRSLSGNLPRLYILAGLDYAYIVMPTIVLFWQANGLTLQQALWLPAVVSVVAPILEVPSGYFADRVGRRWSLIAGSFLIFAGVVIYALSYSFTGFFWASLLIGAGGSFNSGSDTALAFDTCAALKQEDRYLRFESRRSTVTALSESVSGIIGGLLVAAYGLRAPFFAQVLVWGAMVVVALLLVEPPRAKLTPQGSELRELWRITRHALWDRPELRNLIIFGGVTGAATFYGVWVVQPHLQQLQVPVALFGFYWAALHAGMALFSWNAEHIERLVGTGRCFLAIAVLPAAAFLLMSLCAGLWTAVLPFFVYAARGLKAPLLRLYTNTQLSSDIRATVLSIQALAYQLVYVAVGPLLGWISDRWSFAHGLACAGVFFLGAGVWSVLGLTARKAERAVS